MLVLSREGVSFVPFHPAPIFPGAGSGRTSTQAVAPATKTHGGGPVVQGPTPDGPHGERYGLVTTVLSFRVVNMATFCFPLQIFFVAMRRMAKSKRHLSLD